MASNDGIPDLLVMREGMRQWEKMLVEALGPPDDRIEEFYHGIPLSDGFQLQLKIFRPREEGSSGRPLILLFHGGGFATGSCEMCTRPGREFALEFGAVIISPGYRLAPEHKFPQAQLDALDVLQWVVDNADQVLGANLESGFILGGYSAGATIAAAVAGEARSRNLCHEVSWSFLCIPALFDEHTVPPKYNHMWTSRDDNDVPPMGKNFIAGTLSNAAIDPSSPLFCSVHSPSTRRTSTDVHPSWWKGCASRRWGCLREASPRRRRPDEA